MNKYVSSSQMQEETLVEIEKKKKKKKFDEIKIIDVYVIHSLTLHFTPPTLKEFRLAQQKQPP